MRRLFYACLLLVNAVHAQDANMVHQGTITFEKRVNAFAILDEYYVTDDKAGASGFAEQYKAEKPQFKITDFVLTFNDQQGYYKPAAEVEANPFMSSMAGRNVIYTDLAAGTFQADKNIFGEIYHIADTLRKIQWKITDDTKEIAGFSCRRANAIIMDSIYVVAFYTDQIIPKLGPESFTGLPGMILGIALPHEHTTWFATSVSLTASSIQVPPKNSKALTNTALVQMLNADPTIKADDHKRPLYLHHILL